MSYSPKDAYFRSLSKALSWRILATLTTIIISYFVTHKIALAISIGLIELFAKIGLFYLHERLWSMIKFGYNAVRT